MQRRLFGIFLFLSLSLLGWAHVSYGASFTADLVLTQNNRVNTGRIYVRDNLIRQEYNLKSESRITIIRADRGRLWTLMPNSRTYVEVAYLGTGTDLKAYGVKAGDIRETRVAGTETLNGYPCNVIEYVFSDTKLKLTQWVSPKLNYPVKTEFHGLNGLKLSEEIKNISETTLQESLFEIPPGYQKMAFQ